MGDQRAAGLRGGGDSSWQPCVGRGLGEASATKGRGLRGVLDVSLTTWSRLQPVGNWKALGSLRLSLRRAGPGFHGDEAATEPILESA